MPDKESVARRWLRIIRDGQLAQKKITQIANKHAPKTFKRQSIDAIVLLALADGPIASGNVSVLAGLLQPATSISLGRLKSYGLVEPSVGADDRRSVVYSLTPSGRVLVRYMLHDLEHSSEI